MAETGNDPGSMNSEQTTHYVWETLRVAQQGEARASTLDVVGWLLIGAAVVVALAATVVLATYDGDYSDTVRATVALSAVGAFGGLLVGGTFFFGFAALVRNSSRSLTIDTLDSSLNG